MRAASRIYWRISLFEFWSPSFDSAHCEGHLSTGQSALKPQLDYGGWIPIVISDGRQLEKGLGGLHFTLRELMRELPTSVDHLRELLDTVLGFLGEDNIKLSYPEYNQGGWYCEVIDRAVSHLFRSCESSNDWRSALDNFEGTNALPLMTIHKSKGLEYDTVIFLALDDSAWWNFQRQPEEDRSTFFVAFSRAKQRVIFTYCEQRGGRSKIASLYDLLQSAGVRTYESE